MSYMGIDSNIILLDAKNILRYSNVVIAFTVLKEIDSKKTLQDELGYNAREFGRIISKAQLVSIDDTKDLGNVVTLQYDDTTIKLVYNQDVTSEDDINDIKIINTYLKFSKVLNVNVCFISQDVNARLLSITKGLSTSPLVEAQEELIEYHKRVTLPNDLFHIINGMKVSELGFHSDYVHSYVFTCEETNQAKLASVIDGKIQVVTKELEKDLRKQEVPPINTEQLLMSQSIQDTAIDLVIVEAQAGSGKTCCAISNAMRMVDLGKYDGILYLRNSINDVPKNEEVGFLSTNEAKFEVYLHPIRDTLDYIARERLKSKKLKAMELEEAVTAEIESLMKKYNISTSTLLGMRGRTFHKTIVIVDEAQNLSPASMQKVITRMGKGSKMIIIGSNRQIDNAFVTKYDNGLSILMKNSHIKFPGVNLYTIQLSKVVRSAIAEFGELLFAKELHTKGAQ